MRSIIFLTCTLPLFAEVPIEPPAHSMQERQPWLSGTLLSLGTDTTDPGIASITPATYFTTYTGIYDSHRKVRSAHNFYSVQFIAYSYFGITSFLDFGIAPGAYYQFTQGQQNADVADMPFGFDIQLWKENPSVLLFLGAVVPFGKYNHFNPEKKETDFTGQGSWAPNAAVAIGHTFSFSPSCLFNPQFSMGYIIPTSVYVKGYNCYGGGNGTKGTVYPGNILWGNLGLQCSVTQHWTLTTDLYYQKSFASSFSGNLGEVSPGIPARVGYLPYDSLSLAPAVGYCWSDNMNIMAGVWFTLTGKNYVRFISGEISFNINL